MIVIIGTTTGGKRFNERIAKSFKWRYEKGYCKRDIPVHVVTRRELTQFRGTVNALFHPRAAYPDATWVDLLEDFEENNLVVNSTNTIRLTSNKLESTLRLNSWFPGLCPRTIELHNSEQIFSSEVTNFTHPERLVIIKPYTSQGQGTYVQRLRLKELSREHLSQIPTRRVILQEFVNFNTLHRVIVIGGKAVPFTFVDRASERNSWKASTCLNKRTMEISITPDRTLLLLAERVQKAVDGEINFIDFFETNSGYVLGEINTACNLRIHELLAKKVVNRGWNIHYRIAKYLERRFINYV